MPLSMYDASVTVFTRMLTNLHSILEKAEADAHQRKFSADVLANQRLAPDMRPFSFQIQTATDGAKGAVARLTGREAPVWADTETTFVELKARLKRAIDYLATFTPIDFVGSEDKAIIQKVGGKDVSVSGADYLLGRATQNFYFHVTTAYNILRQNGVPIGKSDFLG